MEEEKKYTSWIVDGEQYHQLATEVSDLTWDVFPEAESEKVNKNVENLFKTQTITIKDAKLNEVFVQKILEQVRRRQFIRFYREYIETVNRFINEYSWMMKEKELAND